MANSLHMVRCVYVYPLVQLLSQPSLSMAHSGDTLLSNQSQASRILAMMSWNSKALSAHKDASSEVVMEVSSSSSSSPPPCCPSYFILETTAEVYSLCCMSGDHCVARVRALVKGLKGVEPPVPPAGLEQVAILISAVCWWYGDSLAGEGGGLGDVLELFGCLANCDPTMVRFYAV